MLIEGRLKRTHLFMCEQGSNITKKAMYVYRDQTWSEKAIYMLTENKHKRAGTPHNSNDVKIHDSMTWTIYGSNDTNEMGQK